MMIFVREFKIISDIIRTFERKNNTHTAILPGLTISFWEKHSLELFTGWYFFYSTVQFFGNARCYEKVVTILYFQTSESEVSLDRRTHANGALFFVGFIFIESCSSFWFLRLLRRVKTALGHVSVVLYYVTVSRVGWLVQNKFLIGREKISHLKLSNQLSPPIQSTVSSNNQRPWEINKAQTETCSFFC